MNRVRVAMFLAILCLGCPKRVPALNFGDEGELTDPLALLARVDAAEARIHAVEGESRLRIDSPEQKGTVTLFLAVARPSQLHFEPLNFFGTPQGLLVSDGARFMLYANEEGRTYVGPASAENVSRFLPVVLPPEQLAAILLGQAPRLRASTLALRADEARGGYVLTLREGPLEQTLVIDTRTYRVLASEIRGVRAYDLAFADLEASEGGAVMPREVSLISRESKTSVTIRYTDVKVNATPDPSMFDLTPIEDVPVVEVDALGRPLAAD